VSRAHLDSDLLQEEVDSPVDVSIAVMKRYHGLILILSCDVNQLEKRKEH